MPWVSYLTHTLLRPIAPAYGKNLVIFVYILLKGQSKTSVLKKISFYVHYFLGQALKTDATVHTQALLHVGIASNSTSDIHLNMFGLIIIRVTLETAFPTLSHKFSLYKDICVKIIINQSAVNPHR